MDLSGTVSVGDRVVIDFPSSTTPPEAGGEYVVVAAAATGHVVARPTRGATPCASPGSPCLVSSARLTTGALVLSTGPDGIAIELRDERRHRRYRRRIMVSLEVLQPRSGPIEGVTDDISLGGFRAQLDTPVSAGRWAFAALGVASADPILTMVKTLSCAPLGWERVFSVRARFATVSPDDRARLFALLDWPVIESVA